MPADMLDDCLSIAPPYLLFLGDATDELHAKTAQGLAHWRPKRCLGVWRGDDPIDDSNLKVGLSRYRGRQQKGEQPEERSDPCQHGCLVNRG